MSDARSLDTDRLTLRPHVLADFAESAAMWGDPEVVRHIGGRPSTAEEAWGRLMRYVGHWQLLGFGYWVVRERSTGAFVGEVGWANFRREMTPSLDGAPEAGWALVPRAQGRGYATEAVRAAIAWADGHLGPGRRVCMIDPGNLASIRVANKCGFKESARGTYKGEPTIVFAR